MSKKQAFQCGTHYIVQYVLCRCLYAMLSWNRKSVSQSTHNKKLKSSSLTLYNTLHAKDHPGTCVHVDMCVCLCVHVYNTVMYCICLGWVLIHDYKEGVSLGAQYETQKHPVRVAVLTHSKGFRAYLRQIRFHCSVGRATLCLGQVTCTTPDSPVHN